jgi:hypothetical protein
MIATVLLLVGMFLWAVLVSLQLGWILIELRRQRAQWDEHWVRIEHLEKMTSGLIKGAHTHHAKGPN